jgi:hypothetical protein
MSAYCSLVFPLFLAFTGGTPRDETTRVGVCEAVVAEARRQKLDPHLAVSVAWLESRWTPDASNKTSGARGPLQILPKYWCPDANGEWRVNGTHLSSCDYTRWGVHALRYYVRHRSTTRKALAAYGHTSVHSTYVKWAITLTHIARGVEKKLDPLR